LALLALAVSAPPTVANEESQPTAQRRQELLHLLRHDCGACHGLYLTGGLGPALDPRSLHGKPAGSLEQVILKGRPGTAMPGWQTFLTEREAQWLVETLIHGLTEARENQ
jgi:cytochrome c55X